MSSSKNIAAMIRVNHAGEYGALRIYEGQLRVLGESEVAAHLQKMLDQEKKHLAAFEAELCVRNLKPTVFHPLWHVAGYALGVGSALLGKKAAMACTVAVEEVIEEHYKSQLEELKGQSTEEDLKSLIQQCYEEEIEHHRIGLQEGAEEMPVYGPFRKAIKTMCHLAIWVSEKK